MRHPTRRRKKKKPWGKKKKNVVKKFSGGLLIEPAKAKNFMVKEWIALCEKPVRYVIYPWGGFYDAFGGRVMANAGTGFAGARVGMNGGHRCEHAGHGRLPAATQLPSAAPALAGSAYDCLWHCGSRLLRQIAAMVQLEFLVKDPLSALPCWSWWRNTGSGPLASWQADGPVAMDAFHQQLLQDLGPTRVRSSGFYPVLISASRAKRGQGVLARFIQQQRGIDAVPSKGVEDCKSNCADGHSGQ